MDHVNKATNIKMSIKFKLWTYYARAMTWLYKKCKGMSPDKIDKIIILSSITILITTACVIGLDEERLQENKEYRECYDKCIKNKSCRKPTQSEIEAHNTGYACQELRECYPKCKGYGKWKKNRSTNT